jgi:hypothetical protein
MAFLLFPTISNFLTKGYHAKRVYSSNKKRPLTLSKRFQTFCRAYETTQSEEGGSWVREMGASLG